MRDLLSGTDVPWSGEGVLGASAGLAATRELLRTLSPLLHNPPVAAGKEIWQPATLKEALRPRSGDYFDPIFKYKCNRALGVIVAGDDGMANYRGFGKTNSPSAFGHGGAGGQIGWGDPATGISLGYCTNGFDRNEIRQGRRGVALSSMAAVCAA